MKLNVKKLFGLAIFTSIFCVCLFAEPAEVVSVKGKVEVCRGDEWIPLNVGDTVKQSEVISTGFQSEAKIKMGDSILQLGALSRVTLETLSSGSTKDVVDVYLNTGAVRSKVTHTSDKKISYTVRNPIAVASVRGTEFTFADNGAASCSDGAIALAPTSSYKPNQLASGRNADDVADPADGESDAGTSATDIAPDSPSGSVVVLAGQAAIISADGTVSTPLAVAVSNVTKAASTVTTAASTESVSASIAPATVSSGSVSSTSSVADDIPPTPAPPTTGEINITITYE